MLHWSAKGSKSQKERRGTRELAYIKLEEQSRWHWQKKAHEIKQESNPQLQKIKKGT